MDLLHKFINIVITIITIDSIVFVLPLLTLFRVLRYFFRSVFSEKLEGKVVLITGASSGIGEHLAYEYARHGAKLALVARREEVLAVVAETAEKLGSPEVIVIKADVSKLEDCKRFVDETINHFGKLDCLINNAGLGNAILFEDYKCATQEALTMDVNFWGSVNATHFALPHLRKSKGRIVVVGSTGGWFTPIKASMYNASKAAQQTFFETLRIELGSDVGVTTATLGIINTPLANDDSTTKANLRWVPKESVEGCAKAIVNAARRGAEYVTEPTWMQTLFLWSTLFPDLFNLLRRIIMVTAPKSSLQKMKSHTNGSVQPLDHKHESKYAKYVQRAL